MIDFEGGVFDQDFTRYMYEMKHIMMLFEELDEYRYAASRFVADGLNSNDCCILATDEYAHDLIIEDLAELGVDARKHIEDGSLFLIDVNEHYSSSGGFDPDSTLKGWQDFARDALGRGFDNVRAVGEATFCLDGDGLEEKIIYYENCINEKLFPSYPFMSLCVYNKNRYSEKVLRAAVQAHPMMIFGKKIFRNNVYYVPPEVYFAKDEERSELDIWLANVESNNVLHQEAVRNRERLQQALEVTDDGIWEYNLVTGSFEYSERWANMLGYGRDEVPAFGCFCRENIHPDDRARFEQAFNAYLSGASEKYAIEMRLRTRDGQYRWIYSRGRIVQRDRHGNPVRVLGAHTDISERKNSEMRLEESEQMFRMLFNDAPMPYQSLDENGDFITVNKVFCDTLGYAPDELIGRNFSELLHPDWVDHFRENFPRFKAVGEVLGVEFEMRRKDGEFVSVSFTGKIGKKADGSFRQTHCIFRDISSERAYQASLIQAKEDAEQANHAKSLFLANMSHELRTPLNGIMGMHQLLMTTNLDAEQEKYVTLAMESAKRLTNLLGDILDLTRIEAGKLNVVEKTFDVKECFALSEQLFGPSCRQKGVDIAFDVHPALPKRVVGDKIRLQQILNNLVGNAAKFTESGSIRCQAYPLANQSGDMLRVLFCVSDTGIGIEEEKLDKLFEPFTQAEEGSRRGYQGAGLGLSIVRQLVALMGGSVAVASEPGKGTEFHFCLPFRQDTGGRPVTRAAPARAVIEPGGHSILIAEDEAVNRSALRHILRKAGYDVVSVQNGVEVLEELSANRYDLVLMDIQMPIMDGVEATRAIRSGRAGKEVASIPIVATTAYAMNGDRETFMEAGMDGYLAKPIEAAEVISMMAELLSD